MKTKNQNDEVNAKILQVLDDWDIEASNKALESCDIIWEEEQIDTTKLWKQKKLK